MGLLTEFVVAAPEDGPAIGKTDYPATTWPTLELKNVELVKLGTLHSSISETTYDQELVGSFRLVGGNEEEGPWVFEFPNVVLRALADLKSDRIPGVAAKWMATEELMTEGWSEIDAADVIEKLSAHARLATSSQKSLFLWLSL